MLAVVSIAVDRLPGCFHSSLLQSRLHSDVPRCGLESLVLGGMFDLAVHCVCVGLLSAMVEFEPK